MLIQLFSLPDWEDVFVIFKQICLSIDTIIYNAIAWMYSVFMALAGARIFTSDLVNAFVQRMYLIVSIVMLFIVAYSFMNVIINPDNMTKGDASPAKLVTNVVKSLLLIILVPSIFQFAFSFQKAIIDQNVIGKLILGTKRQVDTTNFDSDSADFSVSLFESNYYPKNNEETTIEDYEADGNRARLNNDIKEFSGFMTKKRHDEIQYNFIISGVVGIYVLYTLLIFSIDLGLRVVKLLFYEMIAPFPALLMIVPGQDKVIKTWVKATLKTFLDLFIKVAIISLGVFLINAVSDGFKNSGSIIGFESTNQNVINFASIFIILGIIIFMKKAPKLIEDLFGFKFDENGLSLAKRWNEIKEGAAFMTAPITKPADKIAGMAYGLKYANRARKIGEKARGKKSTVGQAFMSTAGGLINGFRGGFKHSGYAFDYEMTNQQWYSSSEYEEMSGFKRVKEGIDNRLRNNIDAPSLYREKEASIELKYVREIEPIEKEMEAIRKVSDQRRKDIDKTYDDIIERDDAYIKSIKAFEDHCNSKVQKDDSDIKIGGVKTLKEVTDSAGNVSWVEDTRTDVVNYSTIQAEIDNIKGNEHIAPELKTRLISENTKLQKQLGDLYKKRIERAEAIGWDPITGKATVDGVEVSRDVEFENFRDAIKTVKTRYGSSLGLDEHNDEAHRTYTAIDASSAHSLKELHEMIDHVRNNNASGKKEKAYNEKVEYPDGSGEMVTLFELDKRYKQREKDKKDKEQEKSNAVMALSGYKKMDDIGKKGYYKGKKNG